MSTTNLNLEKIVLDDTLNGTMLNKINSNMEKIDEKYGELKKRLLEKTGQNTLEEALAYIDLIISQG